jgi:hypothetical protein
MSVLELRGVSKTYGQEPALVHALSEVDLDQNIATGTTQPVQLRAENPHGRYNEPMLGLGAQQSVRRVRRPAAG